MQRRGLFFVFSAPSGAGKTSITGGLLKKDPNLYTSISATTRPPRAGELDGQHYYFLDEKAFSQGIHEARFVEHARVFHHYYGTLKAPLDAASEMGKDALLALDSKGARAMQAVYGSKAILIYILPPTLDDLKSRLYQRGQVDPEKIQHRLSCARDEIQECVHYDYVLTNHHLETAIDHAWAIIQSERCRRDPDQTVEKILERFKNPV